MSIMPRWDPPQPRTIILPALANGFQEVRHMLARWYRHGKCSRSMKRQQLARIVGSYVGDGMPEVLIRSFPSLLPRRRQSGMLDSYSFLVAAGCGALQLKDTDLPSTLTVADRLLWEAYYKDLLTLQKCLSTLAGEKKERCSHEVVGRAKVVCGQIVEFLKNTTDS